MEQQHFFDENGRQLTLGKCVGAGGEADVYRVVGERDLALKLYHHPKRRFASKIKEMVAKPPVATYRNKGGEPPFAWPIGPVFSDTNSHHFAGFIMPMVNDAVTLFHLYNPELRTQYFSNVTWRGLHRISARIAANVAALHRSGYVIGDINESNILVTQAGSITMVDTDSYQLRGADGTIYHCPVGRSEYLAPELQGISTRTSERIAAHDAFALPILIFQILMGGAHPFNGVWHDKEEDPPPVGEIIGLRAFPYNESKVISPPPLALPFDALSPKLRDLFLATFGAGAEDPNQRPLPVEYARTLMDVAESLRSCVRNSRHLYVPQNAHCPWCLQARRMGGKDLFPPLTGNEVPKSLPESQAVPVGSVVEMENNVNSDRELDALEMKLREGRERVSKLLEKEISKPKFVPVREERWVRQTAIQLVTEKIRYCSKLHKRLIKGYYFDLIFSAIAFSLLIDEELILVIRELSLKGEFEGNLDLGINQSLSYNFDLILFLLALVAILYWKLFWATYFQLIRSVVYVSAWILMLYSISSSLLDLRTNSIDMEYAKEIINKLQSHEAPPFLPINNLRSPRFYEIEGRHHVDLDIGGEWLTMVWIESGDFVMGRPDHDEEVLTKVMISNGYWIGKYEFTQAQWKAVKGPRDFPFKGDDRPVTEVSWKELIGSDDSANPFPSHDSFLGKLGELTGLPFNLPTEAQWRHAAFAGTDNPYPWGSKRDDAMAKMFAWFDRNADASMFTIPHAREEGPQAVGELLPNNFGLHDMQGNVWEWFRTYYAERYPGGNVWDWIHEGGDKERRATGSGGWNSSLAHTSSRYRTGSHPNYRRDNLGFRVVLEVDKSTLISMTERHSAYGNDLPGYLSPVGRFQIQEPRYGAAVTVYEESIYVFGGGSEVTESIAAGELTSVTENLSADWPGSSCVVYSFEDEIYFLGSKPEEGTHFEIFKPDSGTSRAGPYLPPQNFLFGSCATKSSLYLVGGSNSLYGQTSGVVNEFDFKTQKWRSRNPMPIALEPAVVSDGTILYCLGGWDGSGPTGQVYQYNPANEQWTQQPPLGFAISDTNAVYDRERVFLFGKYFDRDFVGVYDLETGRSAQILVDRPPARRAAAIKFGEWIYLIGGGRGAFNPTRNVLIFALSDLHAAFEESETSIPVQSN